MLKIAITFSLFLMCIISHATEIGLKDSTSSSDTNRYHIPKRAAILSAIVPGAGQIYNEIGYRRISNKKHRAWWKVPVIYGGLGAFGYYYYQNNKMAYLTKKEWEFKDANESASYLDQRFEGYTQDDLIVGIEDANGSTIFQGYDKFANRRDIFAFAFVAFWGLNVIESYVDAHFVTFDVSEDLSLSWSPTLIGYQHPGINLRLNFN